MVEQAVKSRYETITMQTRIRENIALAESAGSGQSIFEYDLMKSGATDYVAKPFHPEILLEKIREDKLNLSGSFVRRLIIF